MTMQLYIILFLILLLLLLHECVSQSQLSTGRIRGEDEPQLVNFRLLEGVTEPFEKHRSDSDIPQWKLMKSIADQKASSRLSLQALHEYGSIVKNPSIFGEMPVEERYDVFLSMSKLLKSMGFYQKAGMVYLNKNKILNYKY